MQGNTEARRFTGSANYSGWRTKIIQGTSFVKVLLQTNDSYLEATTLCFYTSKLNSTFFLVFDSRSRLC